MQQLAPVVALFFLALARAEVGGLQADVLLPVHGRLQPCWPAHIATCSRVKLLRSGAGVLSSQAPNP